MFLKTHTYVRPDDSISIRQNSAEDARAAIVIQDGYQVETDIDLTEDRLRELRDLIGTYLTDKADLTPVLPADDRPPRPLTDDQAAIVVETMTADELRSALRFLAGARPVEFAGAVAYVERQRPATCGGGCGL